MMCHMLPDGGRFFQTKSIRNARVIIKHLPIRRIVTQVSSLNDRMWFHDPWKCVTVWLQEKPCVRFRRRSTFPRFLFNPKNMSFHTNSAFECYQNINIYDIVKYLNWYEYISLDVDINYFNHYKLKYM